MAKKINRQKKNSIMNFVAVAVLTAIGIVLSVCSFIIPFTSTTFNGFANSISLGLDLAGGVSVVYDCSLSETSNTSDLDAAIDATVARLESVIGREYSEAIITRQGNSEIRIEVPSVTNSDEIFGLIGDPTPLYMTLEDGALDEQNDIYISGADIENVFVSYQDSNYGVVINFTNEGKAKFSELTGNASSGNQKIYIYLGEPSEGDAWNELTCTETITSGSTFISAGEGESWTYDEAEEYSLRIMSGTFNVTLDLKENSVISATLGTNALKYCLIGTAVGLFVILLIMWLRYGDFGLLTFFALVIYIVLMIFFLQAISFVQLTLPGLAGIILSIGMAVDGAVIIFEKVREDYRAGKKIPMACKNGFKRAFWPIFDSNITTIFTSLILYILGTASIQGFAITLLIGIILSMFMNLVILRFFVKWYLPLNSVKAKPLHLPKQLKPAKEEPQMVPAGGDTNE